MIPRTRHAVCFSVAVLLLSVTGAQQGRTSAEALLRAAMDKETVDGDLNAAAELYQRVLDRAPDGDAATVAGLRLAGVFEKQGRSDDALALYERTAARAPDRAGVIDVARARLAQRRTAAAGPTLKKVCSRDCGQGEAAVSPSGRRIVWRDTSDTSLILKEISNGQRRSLTTDSDGGVDLVWSPDDAHVAYRTPGALNDTRVRVLDVRNGRSRDLTVGKPLAWSADGRKLLVVRAENGPAALEFAWVSTGKSAAEEKLTSPLRDFVVAPANVGLLSVLSGDQSSVKVAPDGRFMAYNADRKLYVSRLDGSSSVIVSESPDAEFPVGWMPDSRYLLYRRRSDAGTASSVSLWAVGVVEGKPQGAPISIARNLGAQLDVTMLGITRSGTLFFMRASDQAELYGAPLDAASGRISAPPRPLPIPTPAGGRNVRARFSPDSRHVAYLFEPARGVGSTQELSLFSFDTQMERRIVSEYRVMFASHCWTRDGRSLIFTGGPHLRRSPSGAPGSNPIAVRLELSSGAAMALSGVLDNCSNEMFAIESDTGIRVKHIADDAYREIHRFEVFYELTRENFNPGVFDVTRENFNSSTYVPSDVTLSRSGRHVAFKERLADSSIVLRVVGVDGGRPVELARGADLLVPHGIAWSGDDRFVFFCRRAADGTIETFRVPASGGTATSTGYKGPGANDIDVSPDGRRLISAWGNWGEFEIWSMENFLPASR